MLTLVALLAAADVPTVVSPERWVQEFARPPEATAVVVSHERVDDADAAVLRFQMRVTDTRSDPALAFYDEAFQRAGWQVCEPPGTNRRCFRAVTGGPFVADAASWYSERDRLMVIVEVSLWGESERRRSEDLLFDKVEVTALPLTLDDRRSRCRDGMIVEPEWIDTPLWVVPTEGQ